MTPEEASDLFDRLDANGDGVLQLEEWHEAASEAGEIARRRKFQAMDKDGNGVLDRQEALVWPQGVEALDGATIAAVGLLPAVRRVGAKTQPADE